MLDTLTAYENIALALTIQKIRASEIDTRVRDIAGKLDITDILEKYPYQVSGGQKQRIASARAIITNPKLVLADEPTGNLDTASSVEIMELFTELNKEGVTVIVVTHEDDIAEFTNRVIRFRDGQIMSDVRKENP